MKALLIALAFAGIGVAQVGGTDKTCEHRSGTRPKTFNEISSGKDAHLSLSITTNIAMVDRNFDLSIHANGGKLLATVAKDGTVTIEPGVTPEEILRTVADGFLQMNDQNRKLHEDDEQRSKLLHQASDRLIKSQQRLIGALKQKIAVYESAFANLEKITQQEVDKLLRPKK